MTTYKRIYKRPNRKRSIKNPTRVPAGKSQAGKKAVKTTTGKSKIKPEKPNMLSNFIKKESKRLAKSKRFKEILKGGNTKMMSRKMPNKIGPAGVKLGTSTVRADRIM